MRCAVLGDPIEHSLSPVLYRAAFAELGLDGRFEAVRVAEGGLAEHLAAIADDTEVRGFAVTMPLKREAIALAGSASARASMAGAANTLVRTESGWRADNTDIPGAVAAIRERYEGVLERATIIGVGATAASIGLALADLGVTELLLIGRSPVRAAPTIRVLDAHPGRPRVHFAPLAGDAPARPVGEIVVNTIPARAQTPDLVRASSDIPVLFEATYHPWPTPLVSGAGAEQIVVGGLDLLVHQAGYQFREITGESAPLPVMRASAEAALTERGE